MATLKRAEAPATEHRPLFIAFDKVMRTGKDNGVTLYGVVAKFSDGEAFAFEKDQVTLYDSNFGFKDEEGPLTNPCKTYQNKKGYWDVKPLPVGQHSKLFDREVVEVLETPKDAEKKPESDWKPGGGGGGKGGGKTLTKAQLIEAIAWSAKQAEDLAATSEIPVGAAFDKILGCAMFIEWAGDAPAEEKPEQAPVSDDDIPF